MMIIGILVSIFVSVLFFFIGIFVSVKRNEPDPELWKLNGSLGLQNTAVYMLLLAQLILLIHIADMLK